MSDQAPVRHLPEPAPLAHGGRVELRLLESADGARARYEALFFFGEKRLAGELLAEVGPPVRVSLTTTDAGVPSWLAGFAVTLLRTTTRSAPRAGFPRRLTRWRAGDGNDTED